MKKITVQLQDLDYEQKQEYGVTVAQIRELENLYRQNDRLGEYYDNLLYDGFWTLHNRLTVGKANQILYALRNNIEIEYKKPYKYGYNPEKEIII